MARIIFSSDAARGRYERCKAVTEAAGDHSLQGCLERLTGWQWPIVVGCDFDEMSFTFRESLPDELTEKGFRPISGGILYHGPRDGYGSGGAPTFSVTLTPTEGYSIPT